MSRLEPSKDTERWTPVLKPGGIYCSPRCGNKCTKANHDAAQAKAKALAERMGPDWEPRVWENGRWHYSADHKTQKCSIHPGREYPSWEHVEGQNEYSVYLNTNPQFITRHTDPREALALALGHLDQHASALRAAHYAIAQSLRQD